MKKSLCLAACLLAALSCTKPCRIVWTEGEDLPDTDKAVHTLVVQNPPAGTDWKIWFCQIRKAMEMQEGSQATLKHINGSLYVLIPNEDTGGKDLTVRYKQIRLQNHGRAPEGFILEEAGRKMTELTVKYRFLPVKPIHSFEYDKVACVPTDIIPELKSVTPANGGTTRVDTKAEACLTEGHCHGWYRITLDGSTRIEASDADGAFWAGITLENIVRNAGTDVLDNMVIEDWPDLQHRGLMLDVSRNFTTKDNVLKLIDILAHYKANVLHLHLADDEGWRLEIDGLPELTSYGAYRAVPVLNADGSVSEPDALIPCYCASIDRNSVSSANGYYTREDFIEIVRHAAEMHIRVIPEIDMPGHSRAAVKSMEKRFETTGDGTYLLSTGEKGPKYYSAQDFNDNVMNVDLPGTYAFIEKVFDSLLGLYREAGVPLEVIHVGGDEVPKNALSGTDAFICKVMDIAAARGIKIAGWQEIAKDISESTMEKLRKNLAYTNAWTVNRGREEVPYTCANNGLPVVVSIAPNAYVDFAYNASKLERGHSWGGVVDERRTYSLLPFNIYKSVRWDDKGKMTDLSKAGEGKLALTEEGAAHIVGVQSQLWAETIRNFDHVTYYLLPKMLGNLERGWNVHPCWESSTVSDDPEFTAAFNRFYSIIAEHEMPWYDSIGVKYHVN